MRIAILIAIGMLFVCGCQQPAPQPSQNIIVNPGRDRCPPQRPGNNIIVVPPAQPCPPQRPGGIHIDINQCPHHKGCQCPPGCPNRRVGVDVNNVHVHVGK